jgi:hypothetical protein
MYAIHHPAVSAQEGLGGSATRVRDGLLALLHLAAFDNFRYDECMQQDIGFLSGEEVRGSALM